MAYFYANLSERAEIERVRYGRDLPSRNEELVYRRVTVDIQS